MFRPPLRGLAVLLTLPLGLLALPEGTRAHGGGLNAEGCHNDRKRGGYHCHRAPSAGGGRSSPKALLSSGRAFPNCAAARAAGAAPVRRGQPGYGRHLDRDNDGVACESGGGGHGNALGHRLEAAGRAPPFVSVEGPERRESNGFTLAGPLGLMSRAQDTALDGLAASERASMVGRLQRTLAQEGYGPGPADGRMGAQTRAAITRFQTEMALPSTGYLDAATLDALGVANAEGEPAEAQVIATGATLLNPVWLARPSELDRARQYPDRAQRTRAVGDAVVACVVVASGDLKACEVVSESPSEQGFGDAALRLARYYRAQVPPGRSGARVVLPIAFTLPD